MSNEFKQALHELISEKAPMIPWHAVNSGIEIQKQVEWKFETMFNLGDVQKKNKKYLVAYDTLGFFTHLLTNFSDCVTYHSTTDAYIHGGQLAKKWISDIIQLPPKCPEMRVQYDGIFVPTYLLCRTPEQSGMMLRYLKLLLNSGGFIVVSFVAGKNTSVEKWEDLFASAGLQSMVVSAEPVDLRTHPTSHHMVVKLGVLDED
jgi:hypothetical protein